MDYQSLLTTENNMRQDNTNKKVIQSKPIPDEKDILSADDDTMELRKKLSTMELHLAEKTSLYNEEVTGLREQITKLRCSFEKNELSRQKYEHELTVIRTNHNEERRKFSSEKNELLKKIKDLEGALIKKESEMESAESLLTDHKKIYEEEITDREEDIKKLEQAIIQFKKENEIIYEEKLSTEQELLSWKAKTRECEDKVSMLETQRLEHTETIRRLVNDNKFANEKEAEFIDSKKDLIEKIKVLETNIEHERAAHLETKFNTEVLEIKFSDLENSLSIETSRYQESQSQNETLSIACKKLDASLTEMTECYTQLEVRYNELQKDYQNVNNEQTKNSKEANKMLKEVSSCKEENVELNKKLSEVTKELNTCKIEHEKTLEGLKFLLNNHTIINELTPGKKSEWNFSNELIEQTRNVLCKYQTTIDEKDDQLKTLQAERQKINELEWNQQQALQEAEHLVESAQKNYKLCQQVCATHEVRIQQLENEEILWKDKVEERNKKLISLNEQVSRSVMEVEKCQQAFYSTLQIIYELLTTGNVQPSDTTFQYSIMELKEIVMNQLKADIQNSKTTNNKLTQVQNELVQTKDELTRHQDGIRKLQKLNQQVIMQTESSLLQSQQTWNLEKDELLKRHADEINRLESQLQTLQQNKEDAEKSQIELTELSSQNVKLKKSLQKFEQNSRTFNILLNTITVFFWYQYSKTQKFCLQKSLLENRYQDLVKLKKNILNLSQTLLTEMDSHERIDTKLSGILRFRVIVITVLACKRFTRLSTSSVSLTCRNVVLKFPVLPKADTTTNNDLYLWLVGNTLKKFMMQYASMMKQSPGERNDNFAHTFNKMHEKYLEILHQMYNEEERVQSTNLMYHLGRGLTRILNKDINRTGYYQRSEEIVSNLQASVLQFTKRLHQSEIERSKLLSDSERFKAEYKHYKHERQAMKLDLGNAVDAKNSLEIELKHWVRKSAYEMKSKVDIDEFHNVCNDLNSALLREEQLQNLLMEQKNEIQQMCKRVEKHESISSEKETQMTTAYKKLHQQESHIKELHEKFIQLQKENQICRKSADKEKTEVDKYVKEREILAKYFRTVSSALHESKKQVSFTGTHPSKGDTILPEMILPDEVMALDGMKITPELQICQATVKLFVDAQREALQQIHNLRTEKHVMQYKMVALEDDVTTHKQRIQKLKQQISQACQEDIPVVKNLDDDDNKDVFLPLK